MTVHHHHEDHVPAVGRRMPRLFQVFMGGIVVAIVVETFLLWIELQINQPPGGGIPLGTGFSEDVGMPIEAVIPPSSSLHFQQQQGFANDMVDAAGQDINHDRPQTHHTLENHTYSDLQQQIPHNNLQGSDSSSAHPNVQVLQCYVDQNRTYCCADSWEHNVDPWWQQHVDWDVSVENDTTFCFSPIQDERRRSFLNDIVYPLQWQTNCTQNVKSQILSNSGFAANLGLNGKTFMGAIQMNATFVSVKKRSDAIWRYAVWPNGTTVCDSVDMDCYFLPLTHCRGAIGQKDHVPGVVFYVNDGPNTWLRAYMMRPQQWIRKRIYTLLKSMSITEQSFNPNEQDNNHRTQQQQQRQQQPPLIQLPCSAMHVRRTDAILEGNWRKRRNYFALSEYIKHVPAHHKSIVLLTDDQSTIDEAHALYPNRTWIYVNRTRHRGTQGGYNGHLPSGDPIQEMVIILAEMRLAAKCKTLIFTRSGYKDLLLQQMYITHGKNSKLNLVKIDFGRQPNSTHNETDEDFFRNLLINTSNSKGKPRRDTTQS